MRNNCYRQVFELLTSRSNHGDNRQTVARLIISIKISNIINKACFWIAKWLLTNKTTLHEWLDNEKEIGQQFDRQRNKIRQKIFNQLHL
jgi:hypothetical protein